MTRVQRRSIDSVDALVSAARAQFGARGFDAVSTEQIAGAAGRTKGSVYHHFPTKADLFEAAFIQEQRRLADVSVAAGSGSADPVDALIAGLRGYLQAIREPAVARLTLIDAPRVLGWERWRSCDDGPFRALLIAALGAIADDDGLRPGDDPAILAEVLLGSTTEVALAIALGDDRAEQLEAGLEAVLRRTCRPSRQPEPRGRGLDKST